MDPFTYLLIAGGIAVFGWLLNSYGKTVINLTVNQIQSRWQYIFHKRNIVILGAAGSGKTSLIYFLRDGKPYTEVNGKPRAPTPTSGAVVMDANVRISNETKVKWAKIAKDVSGDEDFRDLWKEVIREIDPHGIIYMIDGRLTGDQFKASIEGIFEDVLSEYTKGAGQLTALHVFLNFSDLWATNRRIRVEKAQAVQVYFERRLEQPQYKYLQNLQLGVSIVQLSPSRRPWDEVESALEKFGADLMSQR